MASSSAVDDAVVAVLAGDAALSALLPDGVYMTPGKPNLKRFVVIEPLAHEVTHSFVDTAYERFVYGIGAVAAGTDNAVVDSAAARIDALLKLPLAVAGYTWMVTLRLHRDRPAPEVDAIDSDLRFQQRGGQYEIFLSPD